MLYSKILVAFDGSKLGKKALEYAIELAKGNDIKIEVVYVVHPFLSNYEGMNITELSLSIQKGRDALQEVERTLSTISNKWRTSVLEGQAAEMILKHAKEQHCDLIIMGSRGLSGIKELFLGSVSHYIVQHSPVPVVIVK